MRATWDNKDGEAIAGETLEAEGILNQKLGLEAADYQGPLDELKVRNQYIEQDQVVLRPNNPKLDEICAKFAPEHLHDDDEVRFVLEGEGVFEIRSKSDRWIHVFVESGDLIVVPAGRNHRFFLTEQKTIRCVRLFRDAAGWVPRYREALEPELTPCADSEDREPSDLEATSSTR